MRRAFATIASLLLALTLIPAAARADDPLFLNTLEGLGCFENLATPEYPADAVSKNIDGFVWATIKVSQEGKMASIETNVISNSNDAKSYLVPPVEKAIRAASVKAECNGKTISIDFRYELPQDTFASTPGESSYLVRIRSTTTVAEKSKE